MAIYRPICWRILFILVVLVASGVLFTLRYKGNNNGESDTQERFEQGFSNPTDRKLVEYVRRYWIHRPDKETLHLEEQREHDFSQVGQSSFIDKLLKGKTDGFFVECGAHNGKFLSNTLRFERYRNWTGLLIEPHPVKFTEILKLHRNAYAANVLICPTQITAKIGFFLARIYAAMKDVNMMIRKDDVDVAEEIQVQCFALQTLLLAVGTTKIDYFSLDVEGAEMTVLKTIPLDQIYIKFFTIEYKFNDGHRIDPHKSVERLIELRQFFKQTGLYKEVGILPEKMKHADKFGLDVVFERIV